MGIAKNDEAMWGKERLLEREVFFKGGPILVLGLIGFNCTFLFVE